MISTRGQTRSPGSRRTATAVAVAGRVEPDRVEEGEVDVAGRRRSGAAVEPVPDQVAEHAPADQPVGRVDVAGGPERLQELGGRAHQGLEPPRQVGYSDGIRIHRIG
jgi:hypothetical protein